jgi:DNA-binding HxlR family transcriptional regulator
MAPPASETAMENCSIQRTLDVIGDRWTLLILRDVFRGVRRFSRIQSDLGIARNLLTDRLAALVSADVVERVPYQDRPIRHEYRLTDKGRDLSAALVALMRWGDAWCGAEGAPTELVHDECGTRLELQPWCVHCNEPVTPTHIGSRPGPGRAINEESSHVPA